VILRVPDNFREKPLQIDGAKIFEPVPDRPMLECLTVAPEAIKNREKLALCVSRAFRVRILRQIQIKPNQVELIWPEIVAVCLL